MWLLLLLLPAISALNYKCQNDQVLVVQSFGNDTIRMHCQHLDLCGYQKLRCDYDDSQPACGGLMNFVAHVNQVSATSPVEHTCCNLFNPRPPHMVSTHIGNDCFIYELPDGSTVAKPKEESAEEGSPLAVLKSPADIPEQIDGVTGYRLRLFLLKNKAPPTLLVKGIERRLDGYRVTICRPRCNSHTVVGDQTSDNAGEWKAISWSSWTSSSWSTWAKSVFNNNGQSRTREAIEGSSSPVGNRQGSAGVTVNVDSSGNNNNNVGASDSGEGSRGGFNRATVNGGEPLPGNINITIHTDGRDGPAPSATANAHSETHIHNNGGKDNNGSDKNGKQSNGKGEADGDNDEDLIENENHKVKNSHSTGDVNRDDDEGGLGNSGNSGKGKSKGRKNKNKDNNQNGITDSDSAADSGEADVDSVKVQSRGGDNKSGKDPKNKSDNDNGAREKNKEPKGKEENSNDHDKKNGGNRGGNGDKDGDDSDSDEDENKTRGKNEGKGKGGRKGKGSDESVSDREKEKRKDSDEDVSDEASGANGANGADGDKGSKKGENNKDHGNKGDKNKPARKPTKDGKGGTDGEDGLDGPNADPDADHESVGKDHHKGKNGKDGKKGKHENGDNGVQDLNGNKGKVGQNGKGKDNKNNGKHGKDGRNGNAGKGAKKDQHEKPDREGHGAGKDKNGNNKTKTGDEDKIGKKGKAGVKTAEPKENRKSDKDGNRAEGKKNGTEKDKTVAVAKSQNRAAEAESTTSRIVTSSQGQDGESAAKFDENPGSTEELEKTSAQKKQKTSDAGSKKPAHKPTPKPKAQGSKNSNRSPQNRAAAAREAQTDEKPVRAQAAPVLKTESTGAKMNCFSGDTTVRTPFGEKRMDELEVGDFVIVPSSEKTVKYERVELFYHRQPETKAQFVVLFTESGKRLALTPLHLIPFGECTKVRQSLSKEGIEELVYGSRFAKSVTVNECVVSVNHDGTVFADRVIKVGRQYSTGIYSPMTVEGTLVADGVLASCFSQLESHSVQKVIFDFFYHVNDLFGLGFGERVQTQDIPTMVRYVHQLSHYVLPFAKY